MPSTFSVLGRSRFFYLQFSWPPIKMFAAFYLLLYAFAFHSSQSIISGDFFCVWQPFLPSEKLWKNRVDIRPKLTECAHPDAIVRFIPRFLVLLL